MIQISHTAHSQSPRAEVWQRLSDLQNWHAWGPWTKTEIDGDIRRLVSNRKRVSGKPYVMTERVTALVPEERLEYDLLSGLPLRDYHGIVRLSDADGGGTDIEWSSSFKAPLGLGFLWRGTMLKVLREVSEALAASSEKASDPVS